MIYFDTDVLVNLFLQQDPIKYEFTNDLYIETSRRGEFFVSFLCLQETSFVLHKLSQDRAKIEQTLDSLFLHMPMYYGTAHFKRAILLARKIGFQHINDCLHTAIAEEYCNELYTFNKADFKRIQKHTELKITIF